MQVLQTIEAAHKVFPTAGSSPLLVTCNDFRDWVCKYDRSPRNLFNELIAAKFAEIWEIRTPEVALIKVKKEHVPVNRFPGIPPHLLDKECFGSLYLESSKEVDLSIIHMFKGPAGMEKLDQLANKEDFLKIALFDIWLANEDRNHNNFNLLLSPSPGRLNLFYAIDHVNIFNSSFLNYRITNITEDDSIIKSELAKILFTNTRRFSHAVDNLIESFYLCIAECNSKLDEILDLVPGSWRINKAEMKEKITRNLFAREWIMHAVYHFRTLIQSFILN